MNTTATTNGNGVTARAMLVRLTITTWTGRKYDRSVSDHVAETYAADKDAGRYNKHLLAGNPTHAAILKAGSAARLTHYAQTLPWADEGWRLLPTANFNAYNAAMRNARRKFDTTVAEFLDQYPTLRDEAVQKLGVLYKAAEYPSTDRVRKRFTWEVEYSPVPSKGDIRVDLPDDVKAQIEESITDRVTRATQDAMQDAWTRLHTAVLRIGERTADPSSPLRSTLISSAVDMCDVLGRLNVTQDAALDAMRSRVLRELGTMDIEVLRDDEVARLDAAKRAAAILNAMAPFYTPPPDGE